MLLNPKRLSQVVQQGVHGRCKVFLSRARSQSPAFVSSPESGRKVRDLGLGSSSEGECLQEESLFESDRIERVDDLGSRRVLFLV